MNLDIYYIFQQIEGPSYPQRKDGEHLPKERQAL